MTYLKDKSVKLVKFTARHITSEYINWLNDPEVNRYLYIGRMPVSMGQMADPNTDKNILFAMMSNLFPNDNGSSVQLETDDGFHNYIGTISINSIDWINRSAEIGYIIGDKNYWGRGIATEAVGLAADYALNRLNLHKVEARVVACHAASIKILERNGFVQHGVVPEDYYLDGLYNNTSLFHKLNGR